MGNSDVELTISRTGKVLAWEAVITGGAGTGHAGEVYTTRGTLDNVTAETLQIALSHRALTAYTVYDIRSKGTLYTPEERVYDYTTDNGVIDGLLASRNLPDVRKLQDGTPVTTENADQWRQETIRLLQENIFGTMPDYTGKKISYKVLKTEEVDYVLYSREGVKGITSTVEITVDTDKGPWSFTVEQILPAGVEKCPVFVKLNFRPDIPDRYLPVAQLLKDGCGVVRIYYQDVTSDSATKDGIATMYNSTDYTWGKIAMWSFAAMRVMDYLQEQSFVDLSRVAVIGHSRLGKTALLTAALDTRFTRCIANNSGCTGDALSRGKVGETIKMITTNYPYWFCAKYKTYSGKESSLPLDQHDLLALIAPRKLATGVSSEDAHADPTGQYLGVCAASPMWELYGKTGLVHPDSLPTIGDFYSEGNVEFHLKRGEHTISEYDWACYISFLKK